MRAEVRECAMLADSRRRIIECYAAGIKIDLIAADKSINAEKGVAVDSMLVPGRDVDRHDLLSLVLKRLRVCVRHLKPVTRSHQIEMKSILAIGLYVHMVEDGNHVPDIV